MKTPNKALVIISVLMFCIVLFSGFYPVSAAEAKPLSDLEKYYLSGGTGDMTGVEIKDYDEKVSTVKYPEYAGTVGKYYSSDNDTRHYAYYDLTNPISRFKLACYGIFYQQFISSNKPEEREFYYLYNFGTTTLLDDEFHIIQLIYSFSPMRFELENDKYVLKSDSEIYYFTFKILTSGDTVSYLYNSDLKPSIFGAYSSKILYYSSSCTDFKNSFVYFYDKENAITWQEIYSNCDMEINGHNFKNEAIKSLKNQIDVKLTPEFGLDMENDSFTFSITNNSDTPVQYVMYIIDIDSGGFFEYEYNYSILDEPDNIHSNIRKYKYENNVYDYRIADCMANFEFELDQCKWLYLTNEYYYLFESELDEIIFGFNQDYNLSLSKQFGSTYWHYLGIGKTYTDKIYMQNLALSQNKKYYFRIRAIPLDPSFECSSILFDYDWMYGDSKQLYFEWHMNKSDLVSKSLRLKNHWFTLSSEFHLSDSLKNIYLDSKKVEFLYNQEFSFTKLPAFSSEIPDDSNYNKSTGFTNDKNNVYDPLYKNNLDTGKEEFLKGANAENLSDFDINIDSISIDNVKDYISFPKQFINLIKSFFTLFPQLWALIIFGLTAVIVIAIISYIKG